MSGGGGGTGGKGREGGGNGGELGVTWGAHLVFNLHTVNKLASIELVPKYLFAR